MWIMILGQTRKEKEKKKKINLENTHQIFFEASICHCKLTIQGDSKQHY